MSAAARHAGVRPTLVDGLFYPAEREACAAQVDGLLAASAVPEGEGFGVLAPHAGYEYAGPVMAAAFRSVARRSVRTAVLIGPVHRDPTDAIFVPESAAFATPLGDIPVDAEAVRSLVAADPLFQANDIPHLEEHCLELQVPFLARLFPGLSIVPLLVGNNRAPTAETLARCLPVTFAGEGNYTVFVVTANMASYLAGRDPDAENSLMEDLLARCDGPGMLAAAERRQVSACGIAGIAALLRLCGSGCTVRLLARGSSRGREEGVRRVVHYAAACFTPAATGNELHPDGA